MKHQTIQFIASLLFCFFVTDALAQCPGETGVTVQVVTDFYGSETTWTLADISGSPVYVTGGPYSNGSSATFTENVCVPTDSQLTFSIQDSYGDGICCGYGLGSYTISVEGTTIVSGGEFTFSETVNFLYVDGDANLDKNVTVTDFNLYQAGTSLIGVSPIRY